MCFVSDDVIRLELSQHIERDFKSVYYVNQPESKRMTVSLGINVGVT